MCANKMTQLKCNYKRFCGDCISAFCSPNICSFIMQLVYVSLFVASGNIHDA